MVSPLNNGLAFTRSFSDNCSLTVGVILLFVYLSSGCAPFPDYIHRPTIINIPDRPDSSASADGQNDGADPYRQNNPQQQSGNQENYRNAHAQQSGSITGQPAAPGREGRLSPTVIKSEYVVYDPDHPMADQHGIVYLQESSPGGKSNYTIYDPANPRADKYGNIHLKVRNPNNSKLRSSLQEQDREQYRQQMRNTKNQVLNNPNPAMRSQPDMAQTPPDPARTIAGIPYRRPIVTNVNITETNDTDSGFTELTASSHIPSQSGMSPEKIAAERQVPGIHLQKDYNALKTSTQSVITRSPKTTPVFSSYQSPPPATSNMVNSDPRQSVVTSRPKADPLASPYQSLPTATNTLNSNPGTSPAVAPRPLPDNTVPGNQVNTGRRPAAVNTIEQTIADLERYVTLHPDNMQTQMALRLIYNAYGRDEKALECLPTMSMENQAQMKALTQAIILAAQTTQATDKIKPDLANQALKALNKVCEKLAEKACLTISNLKICGEVTGFGNYKEIDKKELETGLPRRIYVYCELQNFKTKLNKQNMHATDLHADITLFDSAYKPQLRIDKDVPDTPVHNRRRDFYLHGWLDLPRLSPGKYEIFISIKDKIAGMTAPPQRYEFEVKSR
ncbi:MAG: hypothetical protein KAT56_02415 [Sedimentisphaerales bacterium]|nr:hypothetical protein [Sedimentisphaerales bacterium]